MRMGSLKFFRLKAASVAGSTGDWAAILGVTLIGDVTYRRHGQKIQYENRVCRNFGCLKPPPVFFVKESVK